MQQSTKRLHTTPVTPFSTASAFSLSVHDITDLIPPRYLRDADTNNFDETTKQRTDVTFDMENGKPLPSSNQDSKYRIHSCNLIGDQFEIEWGDGRESRYSTSWMKDILAKWQMTEDEETPRILWTNLTEMNVRNSSSLFLSFPDIMEENGMKRALKVLYQYGFLLVGETPLEDGGAGIAALASALSGGSVKESTSSSLLANYRSGGSAIVLPHGTEGPFRTLYGSVWSTTSTGQADGASVADSAYGRGALPLHTDMTYHRDPPGLQIFSMVQPALHGGESVLADGFAVADFLKSKYPEAFSILSNVTRTYRCIDGETGWHLEGSGPVISTSNGLVTAIRHNDLDRLSDLPPYGSSQDEASAFYDKLTFAHRKWDEVLAMDEFRLVMKLKPGDTAVVANQVSSRTAIIGVSQSKRASQLCVVFLFLALPSRSIQLSYWWSHHYGLLCEASINYREHQICRSSFLSLTQSLPSFQSR
jgi:alpha-ketoglutarate-dependent taurine dioxygenase